MQVVDPCVLPGHQPIGAHSHDIGEFACRDLIAAITQDAADAVGLGDLVGSITPGKRADLVVLDVGGLPRDERLAHTLVTNSGIQDVVSVTVDAEFVKRDGRLVAHDLRALHLQSERNLEMLAPTPA